MVKDLLVPLLQGQNVPDLKLLVRKAILYIAVLAEDPGEGPAGTTDDLPGSQWDSNTEFQATQVEDETQIQTCATTW